MSKKVFVRKTVGDVEMYKGRKVEARFCGPDLLCYVDGMPVGQFYLTVMATKSAGRRYIDQCEKEVLDRRAKGGRK